MRISDWSSDVCSSDLARAGEGDRRGAPQAGALHLPRRPRLQLRHARLLPCRKRHPRSRAHPGFPRPNNRLAHSAGAPLTAAPAGPISLGMLPRAAFLLVTLLLAACASPQPSLYAPLAGRDGYAQEELGKGLYRVSFQGNHVTSRERTEAYALYRAAELTLELGAERFIVHDRLRSEEPTSELQSLMRNSYAVFC